MLAARGARAMDGPEEMISDLDIASALRRRAARIAIGAAACGALLTALTFFLP